MQPDSFDTTSLHPPSRAWLLRGLVLSAVAYVTLFIPLVNLSLSGQQQASTPPSEHDKLTSTSPVIVPPKPTVRRRRVDGPPSSSEWLVFLRIPRTGSSSFLSSGMKTYPNNFGEGCGWSQCHCQHVMPAESAPFHGNAIPCSQTTCVSDCGTEGARSMTNDPTHADYAELSSAFARAAVPLSDVRMFTVLREPVERVLSEYRYVVDTFCHANGKLDAWDYVYPRCNPNLDDFVDSDVAERYVHNRMTKMIAGTGDFDWRDLYESEEHMLAVAKRHLDTMSFLLIHERREDSLALLEACESWIGASFKHSSSSSAKDFPRTSTSTSSTKDDDGGATRRHKIDKLNRLDAELYAYGLELFDKLVAVAHGLKQCPASKAHVAESLETTTTTTTTTAAAAATTAVAMSGPAVDLVQAQLNDGVDVRIGEVYSREFVRETPECQFAQTAQHHVGTYSWYNGLFGCAFDWDWYRSSLWKMADGTTFEARSFLPKLSSALVKGQYIVALGAGQTMGIQSQFPYGHYLEHSTGMPVIVVGWGGNGAKFFVDAIRAKDRTKLGRVLYELVRSAKVVVVQAMAGRSASSSGCETACSNTYCSGSLQPVPAFLLGNTSGGDRARAEMRANWVKSHTELLSLAMSVRDPSILSPITSFLYMSSHAISNKPEDVFPELIHSGDLDSVASFLSKYPNTFSLFTHLDDPAVFNKPIGNMKLCNSCSSSNASRKVPKHKKKKPRLNKQWAEQSRRLLTRTKSEKTVLASKCHETTSADQNGTGVRYVPCTPSPRSDDSCTMELLADTCGCAALAMNYYPSPALQEKTSLMLHASITSRLAVPPLEQTETEVSAEVSSVPRHRDTEFSSSVPVRDTEVASPLEQTAAEGEQTETQKFLVFQSMGRVTLDSRNPIMLLDSLCYHHRDVPVFFFVQEGKASVDQDVLDTFASKGCSITVKPTTLQGLVKGTPVQSWIMAKGAEFEKGVHWYSHITDLFRAVAPWVFGGFYLDTDFIILKPIAHLRNTVVWETATQINNAFSVFDRGHPFLEFNMKRAIQRYDPKRWISLGPLLVTESKALWKNKRCPGPLCITELEPTAAFAIKFQDAKNLLLPESSGVSHPYKGDAPGVLAVHYFNKITTGETLDEDSVLFKLYKRNCVVCNPGVAKAQT
jgi:hypothetical protein